MFKIGNVEIGNGAPVSIQSMTNTKTEDSYSTLKQIEELVKEGTARKDPNETGVRWKPPLRGGDGRF